MTDDNPYHRATQDQIAKMGRIGDNDVHAAYVEFRAKESDKVCLLLLLLLFHSFQLYCCTVTCHQSSSIQMKPFPYLVSTLNYYQYAQTQMNIQIEMNNTHQRYNNKQEQEMSLTVSKVSFSSMYLLPISARKKHFSSTSTFARVSQLPQCHEGTQPRQPHPP